MRTALQQIMMALRWFFSLKRMARDLMMHAYRGAIIYRTRNGKWKARPHTFGTYSSKPPQTMHSGEVRYFKPRERKCS